jgi:molybdenum cofactor cytidylyltransferase
LNRVVGILLAAGSSKRFGANKLLCRLRDGEPVALAAARPFIQELPEALAVVRPGDEALSRLFGDLGYRVVVNPDADDGLGASLAAGVRAASQARGWVVGLADMPWIAPASIAAVAASLRTGARLTAPVYRGRRGHPVGLAACWRETLTGLVGDQGARRLFADHAAAFVAVETADAGVVRDVDLPADLAGGGRGLR